MTKTSYRFSPIAGGKAPVRKPIVDRPELKLDHWALPAASFESAGLPDHQLAVQASSGVYFKNRVEGRDFNGWMPARSSWFRPAGTSGSSAWDKHSEVFALSLAPSLSDRLLRCDDDGASIELAPRVIGPDPFIADIIHRMARYAADDEPFGSLLLDGLTVSLIAHLARLNATHKEPKNTKGLTQRQVRRVLNFIEDQLHEDLTLATLAAEANLSERYFCTAFRHSIGVPPYRYLIERRMERAKSLLLEEPALPVTDIALSIGFNSSTHFSATFRELTGLSPSSFRRAR